MIGRRLKDLGGEVTGGQATENAATPQQKGGRSVRESDRCDGFSVPLEWGAGELAGCEEPEEPHGCPSTCERDPPL